ncbi:DEAD/DEAH box helicase [Iodidimonas nitroreducens]|uniref:DEAD-box ATP-dependent RNA helicase RhpA n=1 Tax=Iodidimonas nitroreducens TaxID=1236968 RepID=A0A5A7N617_9PROT|nr:DEAD/DEAH box helicase [Iodidimonas nitroreducens]GAK34041.1 ATP-dependent RNA helicase RhlE [alpha proteobacterium Q-1]GER02860.1 DEAD/DEAH box helicase [Iodidimonas nitroreducens]
MSFEYLGLSDELLSAVRDAGYDTPTPIQRQAIPAILQGRDVIGIAQTGTGKTAGFTLPMLDILSQGRAKARMPRTLILEPTRELAHQVSESFEKYGKNSKLSMALLIGGVSFADQEAKLERGVDVLIATPGRLLDHFGRGKLMLNGVQILVVDECDRMLDMGFIPDVETICQKMPQAHQTLFFSATLSKEIKRLTDQFLNDPKLIEVAPPASTAATVSQSIAIIGAREKSKALRELVATEEIDSAIVFCNRKVDVKSVYTSLKRAGIDVGQLHGDMAQPDRMDTLARFKSGDVRILIASDVAARGLDIPSVSHVFNYDVPNNSEDYVHRIGRTGRAGRAGISVTLAVPADAKAVLEIEKLIGRPIERKALESVKIRDLSDEAEGAKPKGSARGRSGSKTAKKPADATSDQSTAEKPTADASGDTSAKADDTQKDAPKARADQPETSDQSQPKRSGRRRSQSAKPQSDKKPSEKQQADKAPQAKDASSQPERSDTREKSSASERQASSDKDRRRSSSPKNHDHRRSSHHHAQDDEPDHQIVGLGAHVPAFLQRPVPKRG